MRYEDFDFTLTDSAGPTSNRLSEQVNQNMAKTSENYGRSKTALPSGFPSGDFLIDKGETKGIPEDTLDFSKKEAQDGGQLGSGDYAKELGKDIGSGKFLEAMKKLKHDDALKSLEEMRQNSSTKRLTESALRQAYSSSSLEEKVAILYALSNFDKFAKAGNYFTADWTETALDKEDIESFKEPKD